MKRILSFLLSLVMLLVCVQPSTTVLAANHVLTVDLSVNTGAVMHGATGFLYGLGDDGIPTDAVLIPLKPRVAVQKPQGGAQHPNGDVFDVAPQFFAAGGDHIQINLQDYYANWPYENLGINDYLNKVELIAKAVVADPYRDKYVYNPFNEPNWIWYSGKINTLCNDWKTVYNKIRSIDPTARIAGPSYAYYNASDYTTFMTFCKNNNCLPDIMIWHELGNDFFTDWYNHYNHYRSIEASLGISPRPIVINEYGRSTGDLGYPGNMVQWIARFENSKVDACRAYWGAAGNLDELVVENNKVNGDWWLYKWYGDMTGNTVRVTPPSQNSSLQGLASLDSSKKQVRVLLGGSLNSTDVFSTDVVIKGFGSAPYFGNSVHVIVMGIDPTQKDSVKGFAASPGPYIVHESDYNISNGQITVTINNMKALSAYHMIITPNTDLTPANIPGRYEAEYAELSGNAHIASSETNYSGTGYVQGFGGTNNAGVTYVTSVPDDGYYNVTLRYSAGLYTGAPVSRSLQLKINNKFIKNVQCNQTPNWSTWSDVTTTVFLQGGINLITFSAYTNDEVDCVNQDYISVTTGTGTISSYEAEAAENTLSGAVRRQSSSTASGGYNVGYIGNGSNNTLQFNHINVDAAGTYKLVIRYTNAEMVGDHAYNTNVVDRTADITVNGVVQHSGLHFRNTFRWNIYSTTVVDITLNAGSNTIKFSNSKAFAPDIDKISIAPVEAPSSSGGSDIISGGIYKLINRHSGKALDVDLASASNGANVIQWTDHNGVNQKWIITNSGSAYKLVNVNSGKALDVSDNSTADGAKVIQWTDHGGDNQKWNIVDLGNGYYQLINVRSGKYLDVSGSSTADGANVVQWSGNNGLSQQWQIVAAQ